MNTSPDIILATINAKWIHPSLALRLLKANLGGLEPRCEILEFALRQPLKEKIEPILAARPRVFGLSVSIWNHAATLELLKALEENRGGVPRTGWHPLIVLGGPEVSFLPEESEIFRHADYIVRGEGENAFRELCEQLLEPAPEKKSPPGKFIEGSPANLGAIDPGYRLYTDEDVKRKLVYVETGRGCPFGCDFCLSSRDETVRYFPLEPLLANLAVLAERGVKTFKFLDRSFNLDIDRAKSVLEFFLARLEGAQAAALPQAGNAPPFCVHFEMVPSRFPPALKDLLRRFPPGTLRLEIGIQTFNPETASLIHRPGNSGEELLNLKFLRRETGALIHADLIAGLPGESAESFGAGFDLLWQTLSGSGAGSPGGDTDAVSAGAPFEIQLGVLKCLPGTPIVRHSEACGMRYSPAPPYEVIETGALPAAGLEKIKNFARFWEIIVNRDPFPALRRALLPPGEKVFDEFMRLSDGLFEHFGRNWGIDRNDLRVFLESRRDKKLAGGCRPTSY